MNESSKVVALGLPFIKAMEEIATQKGLKGREQVKEQLDHMLKILMIVFDQFPNDDNATQLERLKHCLELGVMTEEALAEFDKPSQKVCLNDSLILYGMAEQVAQRGGNIVELGPRDASGFSDIVEEFMPGSLIETRDEAREQGCSPMVNASNCNTPELA